MTKWVKDRIVPVVFPVGFETAADNCAYGVVNIDDRLRHLVNDISRKIGIKNLDGGIPLEEVLYTDQWRAFRHAFRGDSDFTFAIENDKGDIRKDIAGRYSIKGNTMTISRYAADVAFIQSNESHWSNQSLAPQ